MPCWVRSPPIPRSPCPVREVASAPGPVRNTASGARSPLTTVSRPPPTAGCGAGPRLGVVAVGRPPSQLGRHGPGCPWVSATAGGSRGPAAVVRSAPLRVWRGGRNRARLQGVVRPLVRVPLEGCREAEPLCHGCHWEAVLGPAPGEILVGRPGVEVPGDFLRGACRGVLWCQVPHDGEHRPCGERPRRGGVYTWMVHCGRARRTQDAWSTPWTMSAARTSTITGGSAMIPFAGPPWRPQVCRATFVWPVWATWSTASWMFTLPRVVSSRIQPCATP